MARILSCAAAIVSLIALVTLRPNFVPAPGGRTATAPKSNVMGNPRGQFSAWNEKETTEVQSKAGWTGQDDLWRVGDPGECTFCFIRLAGSNVKGTSLEVELT